MRCLYAGMGLLLLTVPLSAAERFDVRVLYCGDPGSQREADYRDFLTLHFNHVTLRDTREFKETDANGQDVVIFDWSFIYDRKGDWDQRKAQRYRRPKLSLTFSRPTILVAQVGAGVSRSLKLKFDWVCICLLGPAHHLRLGHPLFHSPLEVNPTLEKMPTPPVYPYLTVDRELGPTMDVWKVQTKNYPDTDPGLVAGLYGFNDSPDAEVIAQGIAQKGPDCVSLGRHGNFFLWGFSAAPADMTPAARRLFVNVVCYMRQFDGRTPLVQSESPPREMALRDAMAPRFLLEDYKERDTRRLREWFKPHPEWIPAKNRDDPEAYIATTVRDAQKAIRNSIERDFPEELRRKFGSDAEKYIAYYQENIEYLRATNVHPPRFAVDEDAKAVGPSNRRVEMLERCVTKLEKHEQPELAVRLLLRYTQEKFATVGQWRAWLDTNRRWLFFSDAGGYKFFVAPSEAPARPATLSRRK